MTLSPLFFLFGASILAVCTGLAVAYRDYGWASSFALMTVIATAIYVIRSLSLAMGAG